MDGEGVVDLVRKWRKDGLTYREISEKLQQLFPHRRGFSERSVRRYCKEEGIRKMDEQEIDGVVGAAVEEVGETYGRKMLKGFLDSKGVHIGECKIAESLRRVDPLSYHRRQQSLIDRSNPISYYAASFGHKLHLDQNEKLKMFGVTHVLAIDGYSRLIVAHLTIPVKNNILIYEYIYRKCVLNYGIWEQIRVDCGAEFFLSLFVQEKLRQLYGSRDIAPFVQTPSTQNLTVERIWPHINLRINYPLKRILYTLQDENKIDMTCNTTKFCVSLVVGQTASAGMVKFVSSWNSHFIAGKGIPIQLSQESYAIQIPPASLPDTDSAVHEYELSGGLLSRSGVFGVDPLENRGDLRAIRYERLTDAVGTFDNIFSNVVSGDGHLLELAILTLINTTERLTQLL